MREDSNSVTDSGVGCHIGNMPCNILLYGDDIVLLSPAWHAQQLLLDICCDVLNQCIDDCFFGFFEM